MELLELKHKVEDIFGIETERLPEKIMNVVIQQEESVLMKFLEEEAFDLREDFMQKIFQYHLADREEKKQDFTPKSLAIHVAQKTVSAQTVLDLCAGTGALTIQAWNINPHRYFVCEELDDAAFPFLVFNMCIRNMNGEAYKKDVLSGEWKCGYRITKGKAFSSVEMIEKAPEDKKVDAVISNPPFNIKWMPPTQIEDDARFVLCGTPPANNANLAFVLTGIHRINENGTAAFILPCGVLEEKAEKEIRKKITMSGMLRSVELMPRSMFESTDISTVVLNFGAADNERHTVDVTDWRTCAKQEEREQRGQFGGASHTNRVYKKQINILDCEKPPLKKAVTLEDIEKAEWTWAPNRYISQPEIEYQHRPFEHIVSDLYRINREKNTVKITINQTIAEKMGLDKVAELQSEASKNAEEISKILSAFGGERLKENYISISKNKNEIRIENNSKETVSSIFNIVIPMWKQHMHFLNSEENRVLAELRDAIANDLMTGKLSVDALSEE